MLGGFAVLISITLAILTKLHMAEPELVAIGAAYFLAGVSLIFSFAYAYRNENQVGLAIAAIERTGVAIGVINKNVESLPRTVGSLLETTNTTDKSLLELRETVHTVSSKASSLDVIQRKSGRPCGRSGPRKWQPGVYDEFDLGAEEYNRSVGKEYSGEKTTEEIVSVSNMTKGRGLTMTIFNYPEIDQESLGAGKMRPLITRQLLSS